MYFAMAIFMPYSPAALAAVRAESHELACRVFTGTMGYVPTDMGSPGLLGAVWHTEGLDSVVDAEYPEYDEFEGRLNQLLVIAASLSNRVAPTRVMVASAQCAGGWDGCHVSVFQQGEVVFQVEAGTGSAEDAYANAFTNGACMLGLKLQGGYFPPFERDAFEKLGAQCD